MAPVADCLVEVARSNATSHEDHRTCGTRCDGSFWLALNLLGVINQSLARTQKTLAMHPHVLKQNPIAVDLANRATERAQPERPPPNVDPWVCGSGPYCS